MIGMMKCPHPQSLSHFFVAGEGRKDDEFTNRKNKVPRSSMDKPDWKTFYFKIKDGGRFVVKG